MPWTCSACGASASDDRAACPACGAQKTAWTAVVNRTRTMRVSRRSFSLRAGLDPASRPVGDPAHADPETAPATAAPALDRDHVEHLRACGHAPAPADLLYVAVTPAGAPRLDVVVEPLFAGRPGEEVPVPTTLPPGLPRDATLLVPLLLVRGDGDPIAPDAFPGLAVVETGEDGEPGHAPALEVEAVGKPRQEVALVARDLEPFPFSD